MLQVSCIIVMISLLYVGNASGFLDFRPISVRREKESNREMGNRLHAVPDFVRTFTYFLVFFFKNIIINTNLRNRSYKITTFHFVDTTA